ncbi:MAG: VOC family protein [Nitrososphaerales archaeon]
MLTNAPVSASLPVVDLDRAKRFYQDTLGLKLTEEKPNEFASFQCGDGTNLVLFPRAPTKADHTVASFQVQNIDLVVRGLEVKGVRFMDYDSPEIKTENHIATAGSIKGAWFADTEGNILGIFQRTG